MNEGKSYVVIDEIFHPLINQVVNHLLLLLREPVWLYHALSRWSKPRFLQDLDQLTLI